AAPPVPLATAVQDAPLADPVPAVPMPLRIGMPTLRQLLVAVPPVPAPPASPTPASATPPSAADPAAAVANTAMPIWVFVMRFPPPVMRPRECAFPGPAGTAGSVVRHGQLGISRAGERGSTSVVCQCRARRLAHGSGTGSPLPGCGGWSPYGTGQ